MTKKEKLIQQILSGRADGNINFNDLLKLLAQLGFSCRVKGDHYIFTRDGVDEIINLQPKGHSAKPYQVRQVREIIIKYKL